MPKPNMTDELAAALRLTVDHIGQTKVTRDTYSKNNRILAVGLARRALADYDRSNPTTTNDSHPPATSRPSLDDLLQIWSVSAPGTWENDEGPEGWFAVSNNDGIVAYFGSENDAFRYRLAEINRALNG